MTADSLATVFSPNLIRSAEDDVNFFFANMGKAHKATKMLISHVSLRSPHYSTHHLRFLCRLTLYSTTSSRILTPIMKQSRKTSMSTSMNRSRKKTKTLNYAQTTKMQPMTMILRPRQSSRTRLSWTSRCRAPVTYPYLCLPRLLNLLLSFFLLSGRYPRTHSFERSLVSPGTVCRSDYL